MLSSIKYCQYAIIVLQYQNIDNIPLMFCDMLSTTKYRQIVVVLYHYIAKF